MSTPSSNGSKHPSGPVRDLLLGHNARWDAHEEPPRARKPLEGQPTENRRPTYIEPANDWAEGSWLARERDRQAKRHRRDEERKSRLILGSAWADRLSLGVVLVVLGGIVIAVARLILSGWGYR